MLCGRGESFCLLGSCPLSNYPERDVLWGKVQPIRCYTRPSRIGTGTSCRVGGQRRCGNTFCISRTGHWSGHVSECEVGALAWVCTTGKLRHEALPQLGPRMARHLPTPADCYEANWRTLPGRGVYIFRGEGDIYLEDLNSSTASGGFAPGGKLARSPSSAGTQPALSKGQPAASWPPSRAEERVERIGREIRLLLFLPLS